MLKPYSQLSISWGSASPGFSEELQNAKCVLPLRYTMVKSGINKIGRVAENVLEKICVEADLNNSNPFVQGSNCA